MAGTQPKIPLSQRLAALGVRLGMAEQDTPPPTRPYEIETVVHGSYYETSAGEIFIAEQRFTADYRHGRVAIHPIPSFEVLADWANEPRFRKMPLEAYAFLDVETSGLAGGTGTYAFLVGVGRFLSNQAGFLLRQFFMRDPAEEAALLEALAEFLAPCAALVTFNGKAFDAPLLTTRYALHNIPCPLNGFAHLDLLPLARRLWRDRLSSRALKSLEENILEAPRSIEEVPGYEIPYLYFDYLRSRDARPLKGVFYHNAMDVVAMAALLAQIARMLDDPFAEEIEHGLDRVALARLFEEIGYWETAARLFERGLEMDLSEPDFWTALQRLSYLQKRRGDLEKAVRLWEQAAGRGHIYAHVELAKYYEHRCGDYAQALAWTKRALKQLAKQNLPRYAYDHWQEELQHRRERLERKAQR